MTCKIKEIGHVIPLSTGGYAARVTRYGNGRLLPEPRLLIQPDGMPFTSGLKALDALNQWRASARSCQPLTVTARTPRAQPVVSDDKTVRKVLPLVNHALDYELEHVREARRVKRARKAKREAKAYVPAPVVKLLPVEGPTRLVKARDEVSQRIDELIASGVVEVTRCLPGASRNYFPRRGGILPAHLDPVTLGDHDQ